MSTLTQVADALNTHISGSTYSISLSTERSNMPIDKKSSLSGNIVYVVPVSQQWELNSRTSTGTHTFEIDVILKSDVSNDTNTTLDPLITWFDDLVEGLRTEKFLGFSLTSVDHPQVFDREKLVQDGVFFSIITLSFRGC